MECTFFLIRTNVRFSITCAQKHQQRPQSLPLLPSLWLLDMSLPPHTSFPTRLLINLLVKRKDVLSLTVELLGPEISDPEDTSYYDDDIDELLAEESADTIDTLNRIYNAPQS